MINKKLLKLLGDLKDYSFETYKHSIAVSYFCGEFGRMLDLSEEEIEKLKMAALFHDIGKIWISKDILNKPDKITFEEFDILKMHPIYSVKILLDSGFKDIEVLNIILCHHERLNGMGYPSGLISKIIPELAKILTICDSFDAMRTKRSYKEPMNFEDIKRELLNNSGTQFDPYYVQMFIFFLNSKNEKVIKSSYNFK